MMAWPLSFVTSSVMSMVPLQTPAQADHVVDHVPDPLVELDDGLVRRANLEVDLGATFPKQQPLRLGHDHAAQSPPAAVRRHGQVVDPPAVTFVTRHHRRDQQRHD